jgi:hypothetical protein
MGLLYYTNLRLNRREIGLLCRISMAHFDENLHICTLYSHVYIHWLGSVAHSHDVWLIGVTVRRGASAIVCRGPSAHEWTEGKAINFAR